MAVAMAVKPLRLPSVRYLLEHLLWMWKPAYTSCTSSTIEFFHQSNECLRAAVSSSTVRIFGSIVI